MKRVKWLRNVFAYALLAVFLLAALFPYYWMITSAVRIKLICLQYRPNFFFQCFI